MSTDLRVRVIVPHFYNESGDGGYGSAGEAIDWRVVWR